MNRVSPLAMDSADMGVPSSGRVKITCASAIEMSWASPPEMIVLTSTTVADELVDHALVAAGTLPHLHRVVGGALGAVGCRFRRRGRWRGARGLRSGRLTRRGRL